jgi:hypothetical protein
MTLMMKNCISYGVLGLGLLIYFVFINSYQFVESTIVMLLVILAWSALTTYLEIFNTLTFSKILSLSGFIFAVSFFFFFGVEEIPMPKGAILFNVAGIAGTLFIIFMSILPILYIIHGNNTLNTPNYQTSIPEPQHNFINENVVEEIDDNWEIATDEDIESGNFEVAPN